MARFVHNAAAARHLIEGVPSCAGLHVTALLPEGVSEAAVRDDAESRGVALGDLAGCWLTQDHPDGLVIGFGAIATNDLPDALKIVGDVLEQRACGRDNTE